LKKAFITGVTGQDGSYLAELLLSKDYEVHAILRRSSVFTTARIDHLFREPRFKTYHGDLTDSSNLHRLITKIAPDEIYNLGAQSHVAVSFETPEYTAEVDAIGTIRLLDAIRDTGLKTKFYQASTSELFGGFKTSLQQDEQTVFYPRSPYGAAKLYAYWITINYREAYNIFACNGILFNHESPRRGETFVTKKITKAVANIHHGKQDRLMVGNLDAKRDWGYAKEYVAAMWLMLQQPSADDYVIATGETYTIRQFIEWAFSEIDIAIEWRGRGLEEKGVDGKTGRTLVEIDERYFRPTEVEYLCGNPAKAFDKLRWQAVVKARELCHIMVQYDLRYDGYGYDTEAMVSE